MKKRRLIPYAGAEAINRLKTRSPKLQEARKPLLEQLIIRELTELEIAMTKLTLRKQHLKDQLRQIRGYERCQCCKKEFRYGDTCSMGGCPMGGDF